MQEPKFITFDQMMASVESDMSKFADNGMINRGVCIKVVRKVNHDIGLKIFKEKEIVIKVKDYKADLPEDFMYLQLALICGQTKEYSMPGTVFGTHTYEKDVDCVKPDGACLNSNGGAFWVTQVYKEKTSVIHELKPIRVTRKSLKACTDKCLNTVWTSPYELDIELEEGQIVTNFREGDLYINYLADMVDENNNILVLDHPLLTPYYEYATKKHLLENFYINGDIDVERRLGYIKNELRDARLQALSFANTVEYSEIQEVFAANRTRFYNRFHKMFYAW